MAARCAGPLLLAAALVITACTPERIFSPRLTSELAATPTAQPAPAGAVARPSGPPLSPEQAVNVIGQSYLLLLAAYVEQPDASSLLSAAWEGMTAALPAGQPRPETPALTGIDPREDLTRFRAAYLAAASGAGGGDVQASLAHAAVRRMAESLNDCHTAFSDPRQMAEQSARLRGDLQFAGVGIRIKRRPDEPIVVWETLEGGSAAGAGLKPGDAILKVDGRETSQLSLDQVAMLIRGEEGSQVKLSVERADGGRVQEVTLKRVSIAEPPFKGRLLPENVAYLRLYSFSAAGEAQLLQAIREYESKDPRGWIVDLRTNGGGELRVLLSLLSKFLRNGPFAYEVDRAGQRAALGPDGSYLPRQRPLVVLVSDSTSSAAELFAAAVQHYGVGKVVGTKTAGCLGIGNRFELPDGSGLSVTIKKLLGPAGGELNKVGVSPDEVVDVSRADLAAGRDPQMSRAVALLSRAGR
ncbi:MAG TPA: S41 family peptidase [Chloroflexota bacterium]|nr:S41 family peptidase [Chloroflexota bacterium]